MVLDKKKGGRRRTKEREQAFERTERENKTNDVKVAPNPKGKRERDNKKFRLS